MIPRTLLLCSLLLTAGVLAGCTASQPLRLDSTIDYLDRVVKLGYPPQVTTDAQGKPLDLPFDEDTPKSVQLLLEWEGGDPWVGVTKSNALLMTAFEKVHRSTDLGLNWSLVKPLDRQGFPDVQDREYAFETVMHVDPETDRVFVYHTAPGVYEPSPGLVVCNTLGIPCWYWSCPSLYHSDDDGQTWAQPLQGQNPPPFSCTTALGSAGFSNHPKLATAPRKAGAPLTLADKAGASYGRALYLCDTIWHPLVGFGFVQPYAILPPVPKCSVSFDAGNTWERTTVINELGDNTPDLVLGDNRECQIFNVGRIASAPDGTVYVPLHKRSFDGNRRCAPSVAVSEDEGLTWTIKDYGDRSDNGTNWDNEPVVVVSQDGSIQYFVYRAYDQGVYYMRSRDGFDSWEGPFRVSPANHNLNAYVAAIAGSQGRLAFAYFGTRDWQDFSLTQPTPPTADPNTVWYAFITTTHNADDDAPIFTTDQVTTDKDPVQIGCTGLQANGPMIPASLLGQNDENLDCPNQLNIQQLVADQNGRLIFAFTDGCDIRNDCTTDFSSGFQARDRQLSITMQTSGYSIFEEKGILEDLRLEPPAPAPKCEDLCEPKE